jgi:hypothetical protein
MTDYSDEFFLKVVDSISCKGFDDLTVGSIDMCIEIDN